MPGTASCSSGFERLPEGPMRSRPAFRQRRRAVGVRTTRRPCAAVDVGAAAAPGASSSCRDGRSCSIRCPSTARGGPWSGSRSNALAVVVELPGCACRWDRYSSRSAAAARFRPRPQPLTVVRDPDSAFDEGSPSRGEPSFAHRREMGKPPCPRRRFGVGNLFLGAACGPGGVRAGPSAAVPPGLGRCRRR